MKQVKPYQFFAEVYDEIMGETSDYERFAPYLLQLMEQAGIQPHEHAPREKRTPRRENAPMRVLDIACGTGKVSIPLAERGFEVVGIDISQEMVNAARKQAAAAGVNALFLAEDMRDFTLPEPVGLAYSFGDSINYLMGIDDVVQAFQSIAAALTDDGVFIFDLITEHHILQYFSGKTYTGQHRHIKYIWDNEYDTATRVCISTMTFQVPHPGSGEIQEFKEVHYQKIYPVEEVVDALTRAGFELRGACEEFTLKAVTKDTDRAFLVARKKK